MAVHHRWFLGSVCNLFHQKQEHKIGCGLKGGILLIFHTNLRVFKYIYFETLSTNLR